MMYSINNGDPIATRSAAIMAPIEVLNGNIILSKSKKIHGAVRQQTQQLR